MRRALLLLAGLLAAAPAAAAIPRWAVFTSAFGNPGDLKNAVCTKVILGRTGILFDVYNSQVRTWGSAGVADSAWFAARYAGVLVLSIDGGAGGVPMTSQGWSTQFQDAAAATGIVKGPMGGRWPIPVVCLAPVGITPSLSYNDTTDGNRWVCGITHTGPAGTFFKPASGTWRYRSLLRWRPGRTDTLYSDPVSYGVRPSVWAGPGSVAALAWADTTVTGQSAGDTACVVWWYRPILTKPGIYYVLDASSFSGNQAGLLALQLLCKASDVHAPHRIEIPLMEHDVEPGALTSFGQSTLQTLKDTLRVRGLGTTYATPAGPSEFGSFYTAASLATVRAAIMSNLARWCGFSYLTGFNAKFYASSDTANFRQAYNQLSRTATRTDSLNFTSATRARRQVTDSGISGAWLNKTFKDAGVDVIETLEYVPNASGVTNVGDDFHMSTVNILGDAAHRTMIVQGTYGFLHDSTFTVQRGSAAPYEYIGRNWIQTISIAAMKQKSIYWHTNTVTRRDPHFSWLLSVAANHFEFFNEVVAPDNGFKNSRF